MWQLDIRILSKIHFELDKLGGFQHGSLIVPTDFSSIKDHFQQIMRINSVKVLIKQLPLLKLLRTTKIDLPALISLQLEESGDMDSSVKLSQNTTQTKIKKN